jgi:hypothetical protein
MLREGGRGRRRDAGGACADAATAEGAGAAAGAKFEGLPEAGRSIAAEGATVGTDGCRWAVAGSMVMSLELTPVSTSAAAVDPIGAHNFCAREVISSSPRPQAGCHYLLEHEAVCTETSDGNWCQTVHTI